MELEKLTKEERELLDIVRGAENKEEAVETAVELCEGLLLEEQLKKEIKERTQ